MERLTERKISYPSCDKNGNLTQVDYIEIKDKKLAEEKLCQLEDIEDELKVDLTILFKALNKGFYIKYNNKIIHIFPDKNMTVNFWYNTINVFIPPKFFIDCKKGTDYLSEEIDEEYWFKDYGKTWALTKEELER